MIDVELLSSRELLSSPYVPLGKSEIIRLAFLDLLNGRPKDTVNFLEGQSDLSNDLKDTHKLLRDGYTETESRTLKWLGKITTELSGIELEIRPIGTLVGRDTEFSRADAELPAAELIKKYNSSQPATGVAINLSVNGDFERYAAAPHHLAMTYKIIDHWRERRAAGKMWLPHYDVTINRQVAAFLGTLKTGVCSFIPVEQMQPEDFCFAYSFGLVSVEQAKRLWPSLSGHESNRFEEMPRVMEAIRVGRKSPTRDHRAIMSGAWAAWVFYREMAEFEYPEAVAKSFPGFFKFMAEITQATA